MADEMTGNDPQTLADGGHASARSAASAVDAREESLGNARTDRIQEYIGKALENSDPLRSNLGAMNGDLMWLGLRLREALGKALDGSEMTPERFRAVLPMIDAHLKVSRQVDRFAQLELKESKSPQDETQRSPAKPR